MPPLKNILVHHLYSIRKAIEDFCCKLYESVKFGAIIDKGMAALYNVGERTKTYTYKRRSCVEYGLIVRGSSTNSLSQIGKNIMKSNNIIKSKRKNSNIATPRV